MRISLPLVTTHFIYTFVASAIAIIIPLYLIYLSLPIEDVGLILGMVQISFLVFCVLSATVADESGTRILNIFSPIANIISVAFYLFATTTLFFAIGKIFEGMRSASFWAVSRTDIMEKGRKKEAGRRLAFFAGIRGFANGFGKLGGGFLIAYLAFQNTFLFLIGLLFLMLFFSFRVGKFKRFKLDGSLRRRVFARRSRQFWKYAIGLMLVGIVVDMLFLFLMPLYAVSELHYSYIDVGLILAFMAFVSAVATVIPVKRKIPLDMVSSFTLICLAPSLVLLPIYGEQHFFLWLAILSLGIGFASILMEVIMGKILKKSRDVSTDTSLIMAPLRLAEFFFMGIGGFVIAQWGYLPLFAVCSLFILMFLVFAQRVLKIHLVDFSALYREGVVV